MGAGHRPRELCGAVPGIAPLNRAPDSTKISTLPAQPWVNTALLTSRWAPFVPPSTSPGTAPAPHKGSSLPSHPEGRIFTSLNLPWLQVLWAAASPMPRAWASQCSPMADWQNEPGRREASKHRRHFGGVCAAPQIAQDGIRSTSMAQPAWEKWGTDHSRSHRSQGKRGVREQEG